jgi:hypothetical protein
MERVVISSKSPIFFASVGLYSHIRLVKSYHEINGDCENCVAPSLSILLAKKSTKRNVLLVGVVGVRIDNDKFSDLAPVSTHSILALSIDVFV